MRTSIRIRMILAMDLLVVALGVVVGWLGIELVGREIDRKLVDESVANAAGLIGEMHLPATSDALMQRVGQILGAEVAAGNADGGIVSSSMPGDQKAQLLGQVARRPLPAHVTLSGRTYRLGSALMSKPPWPPERTAMRLYLLVPQERVDAAKRDAARDIALVTISAIVAATLVSIYLSTTISRPVRRLADRMDELAREAARQDVSQPGLAPAPGASPASPGLGAHEGRPAGARCVSTPCAARQPAARRTVGRGSPSELVRLADSFDRLMRQLAQARASLARSARLAALGKMSASVVHELRNPLSGIRMNAQVLSEELSKASIADKSLDLIVREIDRIDLYLQEMLSLAASGGENGKTLGAPVPALEVTSFRLDELADSVVALLSGRCGHAGVSIQRRYNPNAVTVTADAGRIRQVVLNLMLNAMEALPEGGTITLSTAPGREGLVRFGVADSGRGVQVDEGVDVFEPFVSTRPEGAGLGLYICRHIVTSQGGRIGYDSSPAGATFWFELPAGK